MLTTTGKVGGIIGQSSEGVYLAQILLKFSERDQRDLTIDDLQNNATGIASAGGILGSGVLSLIMIPIYHDLFTHRQDICEEQAKAYEG